jgi:hypothetical protein
LSYDAVMALGEKWCRHEQEAVNDQTEIPQCR